MIAHITEESVMRSRITEIRKEKAERQKTMIAQKIIGFLLLILGVIFFVVFKGEDNSGSLLFWGLSVILLISKKPVIGKLTWKEER